MIVDCGCGGKSRGDINLDLYIYQSPDTAQYIDIRNIKNFINCSITNIPLRDKIGDVTCYHTIEHILYVNNAIIEMRRISKNKVIIIVPNNPVYNEYGKHLYSWSKTSLCAYLKCFFYEVRISVNTVRYFKRIHKIIRLVPVFFVRRKIYQFISKFVGFEIIAVCEIWD